MNIRKWLVRILFYLGGFAIMTMGIALSKRSGLGVSPVSTIPYTIWGITTLNVSITTILFHVALVILQVFILRKEFQLKSLLQIPAGIIFGLFTGLFQNLANMVLPDPNAISGYAGATLAIVMNLLSTVFIAVGLFFYVPVDIIPLAGEGATLAISKKTGVKFSTIKIFFDCTIVISSFISCVIYKGGWMAGYDMQIVGIGTVIAAVLVGANLKLVTKLFGGWRESVLEKIMPEQDIKEKAE